MQTITIKIMGMTCMGCVNSIMNVLEKMDGVANVAVSLEQEQASIEYDSEKTGIDQIRRAIEDAGFDVAH
ncbi:MAG: heavy-metal-associated domain-containing protein [Nitrosomonas sp.]|nr:heavy-metal-associated domain-containing protein [Nitrosomonas sp.]